EPSIELGVRCQIGVVASDWREQPVPARLEIEPVQTSSRRAEFLVVVSILLNDAATEGALEDICVKARHGIYERSIRSHGRDGVEIQAVELTEEKQQILNGNLGL